MTDRPGNAMTDRPRIGVERIAWSPAELALALGCTRAHIHNLITRGELPSFMLGRRRMIPADAVDRLLATAAVADKRTG